MDKMTLDEIRDKFDNKVDYYSNAEAGQENMPDAGKVLSMMMDAVGSLTPLPVTACDIGCGAGNFSVRLSRQIPQITLDLVDLSMPMLQRATERVSAEGGKVRSVIQGDIREVQLKERSYDTIVSGAALHHLRAEEEWEQVLQLIYKALKPGGTFWYWDLIDHDHAAVRTSQYKLWGDHLKEYRGEEYRDYIFKECAREDSPRSLPFITKKIMEAGFSEWDILHKSSVFAAIMGVK